MHEDTHPVGIDLDDPVIEVAVEVFSLIADPTRVRIVLVLRDGECSVGDLAMRVGKAPTAVSQHLAKLRWGRIVHARQEGNRVYYSLVDEHAAALVTQAIYQAQHAVGAQGAHHRDSEADR